jgi:gliding motility-associated-like protein
MSDKDPIKDLFRDKLQSHEVMPSKAVWSSVSSSLGHSAASTAGVGSASFLKVAAIAVGVSAAGVAGFLFLSSDDSEPKKVIEKTVLQEKDLDESISSETTDSDAQESASPEIMLSQSESLSSEKVISNGSIQDPQPEMITTNESLPVSTPSESQANALIVEESTADVLPKENPVSPQVSVTVPAEPVVDEVEISATTIEATSQESSSEEVSDELEAPEIVNEEQIVLPNIFTPNGDRVNDIFEIKMEDKLEFQIVILNQQNQPVFKSTDAHFQWDGTMLNGQPAPSGTYLYYFSAKDMNGKDVTKSSLLTINR